MKKNMLIAIIIATFFSCTEVLDELANVGIDPDAVADSLNLGKKDSVTVEDSVIVEDSIIVEEPKPEPPVYGNSGGLFTQQELAIWKERAKSPQFSEAWARISKNANEFLSNPSAQIWKHNLSKIVPTPAATPAGPTVVKPEHQGTKMRDAAFYYLLTGDVKYGNQVRTTLLQQVSEPSVNFSNRTMWHFEIGSVAPMFHVAEWVTVLIKTYQFSKNMYSESERAKIEGWFHNAGKYFDEAVNRELDALFVNRQGGNYNLSGYAIAVHNNNLNKMSTHIGGHAVSAIAAWRYQNRQTSMVRTAAEVGFLVGDASLKKSAQQYVKESVRFWAYSDGLTVEFERANQKQPEAGLYYSNLNLELLLSIADLFARHGDLSLFDYKTSQGWAAPLAGTKYDTGGGEKSLWKVARTACELKNKEFYDKMTNSSKIYAVQKTDYYLIDGYEEKSIFTGTPLIYVQETNLSQYNIYFNDPYIKQTYSKCLNTSIRKSYAGPHHWDQGAWGVLPSKSLMYWDMEGKIWPYSGNVE